MRNLALSYLESNLSEKSLLISMTMEEDFDGVRHVLQDMERSGDVDALQRELNATSSSGKTALMIASSNGSEEIVAILLYHNAALDLQTASGETALHFALHAGFFRIAQVLIERGANVPEGDILRMILGDGKHTLKADLVRPETEARKEQGLAVPPNLPPLSRLSYEGKEEEVVGLLNQSSMSSHGYDIDGADEGFTPFLLASLRGHLAVMRHLLLHGANINTTTNKGWTALMFASKRNDEDCVRMLLSEGADVNHLSPDRRTALSEATIRGHIRVMELLLEARADTDTKSQHDWTPLMHAAYIGDIDSVNLLLKHGATTTVGSARDETPLLLASAAGSLVVVEKLLEIGCAVEPNWANPGSQDGLSNHNDDDSQPGFVVERAYQVGWTPVMLACQSGSKTILELLLDRGACLTPRSPMFKRALDIAKENGRTEIVKILEQRLDR
jgi:ankyrin repeat domain-containing protein 17